MSTNESGCCEGRSCDSRESESSGPQSMNIIKTVPADRTKEPTYRIEISSLAPGASAFLVRFEEEPRRLVRVQRWVRRRFESFKDFFRSVA